MQFGDVTLARVKVPWGSYNIARNLGVVALGSNLVALNAVLYCLIRVAPVTVSYLQSGEEVFGHYSRLTVKEAELASKEWFPV